MIDQSEQQGNGAPGDSLQIYSAVAGVFDEMQQGAGTLRPHWRPLVESLQQLGRQELQLRWENGRRIIRDHGVTYATYGDPEDIERPWGLDFVPLLITGQEWARIEASMIQRSRLLNLILADIYGGSQRLLRDGFLPPELVYANPLFLRPCRGVSVTRKVYLHLHACDLGRSPNGQWWVLNDRTQAPGGAGYAWENRTVVSRILPEQIRQCNVQRLSGFFRQQREMLFNLAPPGRNQPSIVLLTPGPHNKAYFEHAYLARQLGFPLVEGEDLTVRERRVFLKTIEGLQLVDVILRRVDDELCDPLELRGDSFLGVSGLIEATRAGNVTVANAVGAGLMESPAFLAFLPSICRHLLAEELLMPSIATWWCGQARELLYATEHLDELVIKSAFAGRSFGQSEISLPRKTRRQAAEERTKLLARIQATPHEFVAQERVKLSRAPAWVGDRFASRSVVIRTYVANGGDSFAVLPGGLARTSKNPNDLVRSMQSGGGSKDTWILSKGAMTSQESAPLPSEPRFAQHVQLGVPSRAADCLFWLGRYTERLEQLLRVLGCVLGRISGEPGAEGSPERTALGELAANLGLLPAPLGPDGANGEVPRRILYLLYEPAESSGVRGLLANIRSIALAVRDRFSGDTWRILGRLETDSQSPPGRLQVASATGLIHNLVLDLAAFNGMEMENMTRGGGWRFLDAGRRLERGLSVVKLLQAVVRVKTKPAAALEPVLEIADSVMTYRRQYFAAPHLPGVLALLVKDESNPRSLAFQVNVLNDHSAALMARANASAPESERARMNSLRQALQGADLNGLAQEHAQGTTQPLQDLLESWATEFAAFSDEVTSRYFNHITPRFR
jgi:uncharacterized circularly permuted ATP-grasp superfamily protein/uncharacterized alpha-E superfamily protein